MLEYFASITRLNEKQYNIIYFQKTDNFSFNKSIKKNFLKQLTSFCNGHDINFFFLIQIDVFIKNILTSIHYKNQCFYLRLEHQFLQQTKIFFAIA